MNIDVRDDISHPNNHTEWGGKEARVKSAAKVMRKQGRGRLAHVGELGIEFEFELVEIR